MTPSDSSSPAGPRDRTCLITGATGFIGGRLARRLVDSGWRVRALARPTSDRSFLADLPVQWVNGDLAADAGLAEAIADAEVIFHCAGLTKALNAADLFRVNEEGTRRLLEAAASAPRKPGRIVILSSQAAAGPARPDGSPRLDADPPEPVSLYGRSKLAGERVCENFFATLPIVILRPVAVYGPQDRDFLLIFRNLAKTGLLLEPGPRPLEFQVIHADDLTEAIERAALAPADSVVGKRFFTGHPRVWASDAFGREVGRAVGRPAIRVLRLPWSLARAAAAGSDVWARLRGKPSIFSRDKIREIAAGRWIADMSAFTRATGFTASRDAPEGLRETAGWYRARGWL